MTAVEGSHKLAMGLALGTAFIALLIASPFEHEHLKFEHLKFAALRSWQPKPRLLMLLVLFILHNIMQLYLADLLGKGLTLTMSCV